MGMLWSMGYCSAWDAWNAWDAWDAWDSSNAQGDCMRVHRDTGSAVCGSIAVLITAWGWLGMWYLKGT